MISTNAKLQIDCLQFVINNLLLSHSRFNAKHQLAKNSLQTKLNTLLNCFKLTCIRIVLGKLYKI